jgi:hypothetical protein
MFQAEKPSRAACLPVFPQGGRTPARPRNTNGHETEAAHGFPPCICKTFSFASVRPDVSGLLFFALVSRERMHSPSALGQSAGYGLHLAALAESGATPPALLALLLLALPLLLTLQKLVALAAVTERTPFISAFPLLLCSPP